MRTEIIYENHSLYRDSFKIMAYIFGTGKKTVCIVGNMRGNEYQQLYTCSRIVQALHTCRRSWLSRRSIRIP